MKLKSGRKNQIRVHFSEAGHPIVGDRKYGAKAGSALALRSVELTLCHPVSGQVRTFAVERGMG